MRIYKDVGCERFIGIACQFEVFYKVLITKKRYELTGHYSIIVSSSYKATIFL